jgi:aminoglycoside phosphotransferase (APT) family kinase protein
MLPRPDAPRSSADNSADSVADSGVDLARLATYLEQTGGELAALGPLRATRLTGGRSNLTYLITDGRAEFVLRRPPLGPLTPRAYDVAREFRMMDALSRQGVRVPALRHLCQDESVIGATFMVMDRVHGAVLRDAADVAGLSGPHRLLLCEELVGGLAELHAVEPASITADAHARGASFVERQVARWTDQWRRWQTRELPALDDLGRRLAASVPVAGPVSVVHGDFRFDNVMFDDELRALSAIFDWELSSIGDPLTDLGLLIAYWATDGSLADVLPHKRLTAALQIDARAVSEQYATISGRSLDDLEFYIALGYFKWAVIREGVYRRQLDGAMPDEDSAALRASVEVIADAGRQVAAASGRPGLTA